MNSFPKLSYACPIPWANLKGDERTRFCEKCGHTIVNFSLLDEKARRALLAKADSERLCVTYYRRLSGEFVTPESPLTPRERASIKQIGVAALSAGALALAAGCMSSGPAPSPVAPPATHVSTPSVTPSSGTLSEAEKLARYDKNKNGKLDPNEIAAMETDLARGTAVASLGDTDTLVLQPFGIAATTTPAQEKKWLERRMQAERDKKAAFGEADPFSEEEWQEYWAHEIAELRNPQKIGGVTPRAEEYVHYIISQRRKYHLPELKDLKP